MRWPAWLRLPSLTPANLLGPDIIAEVCIHVLPDFSRKVYASKFLGSQEQMAKIVQNVVATGFDLGQQHGITIQFNQPPPQEKA